MIKLRTVAILSVSKVRVNGLLFLSEVIVEVSPSTRFSRPSNIGNELTFGINKLFLTEPVGTL